MTYEPSIHAGINIKINREESDDKKATILVFQSNDSSKMCNLIITGVTNENHILKAYNFISQILELNKSKILKIDVEKLMEEERIRLEKEEQLLSDDLQYFDNDRDVNMSSVSSDDLSIFVKGA